MRRRRKHLEVSTFPFLAVLLCTMGSLILVLLVMHRKAHRLAEAKAHDRARQQKVEHDRELARRHREHEKKKQAQRQAWEQKRSALRARAQAGQQALDRETSEVQARLAEAARKLREEQDKLARLGEQLVREKQRLAGQSHAVAKAEQEAAAAQQKKSAGEQARARLTAQVADLERSLQQLQAARRREASTYSVIPYRGKHGENRRPIYVECNAEGILFHPDQQRLAAAADLRTELQRRLDRQQARLRSQGVADARPYIMLLVRPRGLERYYEVQAAARALDVDFGYEFVDADWVLKFPEDGDTAPLPLAHAAPPSAPSTSSSAKKLPAPARRVAGPRPVGSNPSARPSTGPAAGGSGSTGGPLLPRRTALAGPAALAGLNRLLPFGAEEASEPTGPVAPPAPFGPLATTGPALPPSLAALPGLSGKARGSPGPAPGPPPGLAAAPGKAGAPLDGPVLPPAAGAAPAPLPQGIPTPTLLAGRPGSATTSPPGPAAPAAGKPAGSATAPGRRSEPAGFDTPPPPGARRRPPPILRPAQLGGGESSIFIECRRDVVIVYPGGRRVGIDSLNHSLAHNPLYQTVQRHIARYHKLALSGQPPRIHVRFLIHPDAEQTFHLAYPALESLPVPRTRYSLQPEDDVSRLVTEY